MGRDDGQSLWKIVKSSSKKIINLSRSRGIQAIMTHSFEHFILVRAKERKTGWNIDKIYIKFQLIKDYVHANNKVFIFCIKNCEFWDWVGLEYISQHNPHSHHNLNINIVLVICTVASIYEWMNMWSVVIGYKRISLINMHESSLLKSWL